MLLSFVIPTYNRAFKVQRAIDSVLTQLDGGSLVEIVVVDDGSTDYTQAALKAYVDNNMINYVRHPFNKGVAAAKNTGIVNAKFEYVVLLDSDDLLAEGGLKYLLGLAQEGKYDVIFSGSKVLSSGKLMFDPEFKGLKSYPDLLRSSIGEYLPTVRTAVMKRHLFRELRGYESISWLLLAKDGFKTYYDPTVVRLYDDEGDDRLSNRLGILKNARNMMKGHSSYLKEFGNDLKKSNIKAYVILQLKLCCYFLMQLFYRDTKAAI